jgi:pyruvate/2-oxoglutarate dehydrogenase complex dihydrolipoamide acyltransferase (E2) component
VPGALVFSLRLLVEALLVPVRRVLRAFGVGGRDADRYEPTAAEPPAPAVATQPPPAARRAARKRPPQRRATPRRAEPTRGEVAAMREAAREAETGGADSVGAQVHIAEPWAGYDEMRLDEILARLKDATDVELAVVSAYERGHEARQAILLVAGEPA